MINMEGFSSLPLIFGLSALFLALLGVFFYWASLYLYPLHVHRSTHNPVLAPDPSHWWESEAVFNPAAVVYDNKIHLFYRALGGDGISRIGYAVSNDGVHFDRYPNPAYEPGKQHVPQRTKLSYATLSYSTNIYASGGGWGGSEDPRAVIIDGRLFLTFTAFENWGSARISLITLPSKDMLDQHFAWSKSTFLSPPHEVQKNWVLFPEKINGKFVVLHNIWPKVEIAYVDNIEALEEEGYIKSTFVRHETPGRWDAVIRGAGAPPIKTKDGWLLFYHGFNPHQGAGYNVGAMLLDLKDPTKILHKTAKPILTPAQWYENEWKAGVVYASGAVVFNDQLIIYYGGGDKYVAAASANLNHFIDDLAHDRETHLIPVKL